MKASTIFFIPLLATSAFASSVITIPLTKIHRNGTYLKGSPDADRARAALLKLNSIGRPTTVPATNLAYSQYTTRVGIGKPATYYNLVVDTGSSNTWCGAGTAYVRTSSSIPTGENVTVIYGTGNFTGKEYLDEVTLGPNLVITNQSIGDALSSADFQGVDGIIGIGPIDLTGGTLSPDQSETIPTVMNNLKSQGVIEKEILGVYFAPSINFSDTNGALTYGGINPHLYEGGVTYVPVTKTSPSSQYWGINITSSTYGTHTIFPTSTAGIVDTGTTLVLLADDFFSIYLKAIPGAKIDPDTSLIEIPHNSISSMKDLNFEIGGRTFKMDVAAQLIPTNQNTAWGGVAGKHYGVVLNMGGSSGAGLDFIIGQKFMERYYAVFDANANQVGFAQTNNTFTTYRG